MSTVINNEQAKKNISANVRRLLEDRGWDQIQLAALSGETAMMISRIVRKSHMPGAAVLARIAEAFDVSVDRLLASPPEKISKSS